MAIDTWLFDQHALGLHPPTLRFYTWCPPAISLGSLQKNWPQLWEDLIWQGQPVSLVRRPSGGRGVLHQGDLTYMVVISGLGHHRRQVYRRLCEFLIQGWRSLQVKLAYGQARETYHHNPNCFATATEADLVLADGSKFIGSAQAWRGRTVLQHGSIQLNPDPVLYETVFATPCPRSSLPDLPIETITQALLAAAQTCFQMQAQRQPLTPNEWRMILNN